MRLTLRTLLSYLDNVLDEPSRKALEVQIEKGENASEWVHRTRDVMRRLKLGAPELHGSGSVDDPNTVAEYLDRTLPEEGVAEFERVCLESDTMLAEVASCHHVLAMVLTEPAAIDPDTRKRLHRLQDDLAIAMKSRIEAAHPAPDGAASSAAAETPAVSQEPAAQRVKPAAVPSYLQESAPSDWMRWAPALAALLLLAVTAGLAFGPGGWLSSAEQVADSGSDGTPTNGSHSKAGVETGGKETDSDSDPGDVEKTPGSENPTDLVERDPDPLDDPGAEEVDESLNATVEPDADLPTDAQSTAEVEEVEPLTTDAAVAEAVSSEQEARETAFAATDGEPEDPAPLQEEPQPLATMESLSGPEELAVYLAPDSSWQRLRGGLETSEKSRLICLPTYRTEIRIAGDSRVEMVGLTEAIVDPQSPSVALSHGRIILSRAPDAVGSVTIELVLLEKPEQHGYQIELWPGSVVAIAADRVAEPGYPLLRESPPLAALAQVIVAPVGYSRMTGDGGAKKTEPETLFTRGRFQQLPDGYGEMKWVPNLALSLSEGLAYRKLAQEIVFGKPVLDQARTIASEFDLFEVRSLAARCCLALGDAQPIAESFGKELEEESWPVHFAAMRQSASRSIAAAGRALRGFVLSHGENGGAALFELVTGFTAEQVGTTPSLVSQGVVRSLLVGGPGDGSKGLLESRDLATRVLAGLVLDESVVQSPRPYNPLRSFNRSVRVLGLALDDEELEPKPR